MYLNNIKIIILLCCFGFVNSNSIFGQARLINALESTLQVETSVERRMEVYQTFFDTLAMDSLPRYKEHLDDYYELSMSEREPRHIIEALYHKSRYLTEVGKIEQALAFADTLEASFLKYKDEIDESRLTLLEVKHLLYKSLNLYVRSRNKEAVEINYELIGRIEEIGGQYPEVNLEELKYENYMVLTNNYMFDNDSIANFYLDKALNLARRMDDEEKILRSINVSYYTNYYGNNAKLLNSIADSCIRYSEKLNIRNRKGEAYMHKCNALVLLKKLVEAEVFCQKAVDLFALEDDPIYLSGVYNNVANVFEKTDDPSRSLPYYEKSYQIAKEIENGKEYLTSLNNLARKYFEVGRYKESSEHFKVFADSQLVYYENLLSSQFTEAESKYQNGQREVEIANQKIKIAEEKSLRNRIIWGSSILLLLGFGFFQRYRNQQKHQKVESALALESQRKEAEQLKELDKMKTQFFTNVSHELRTPLTLITGPLENILEKSKDSKIRNDLSLAHSNSKKLLGLINEILDLAKMESGKMKLNPSATHIHSLINRVVRAFDSYAQTKNVEMKLHNRISEDQFVKIDIEKLEKILNNLLSNAIKFSNSESQIHFEAGIYNDQLHISVADQGVGISPNDEARIFERFYQSNQNTNTTFGGTGVGLALCKEIVDLMKGRISAENNSDGGATFVLELPIEQAERKEVQEKPALDISKSIVYSPISINGLKPRVLIVEDNKDMSDYIASILSPHYECSFAYDGYECLQKVQKEHFDIISSDVMMPRMDGFTLKKKINELERSKHLPFIFLTAKSMEDDKLYGLNLGVDDYISKPFNKNEYLTRIHNLLQNKKVRDELLSDFTEEEELAESVDRKSLKRAELIVLKNLQNLEFKIQNLADGMNYSQRQLTRIIKRITGLTPVNFILEIRLQKAYQLLNERQFQTISEVRYEVGIESASYFTKKFNERFGLLPSEMLD